MQVTDRNIGANPTGFDMRTEINNIIAALESDNSGSSEPLNTVAYMKWLDTSNATYYYYKERNHDNTAWVTLFRYTVATKIMEAVSNGVVLSQTNIASEIHASSSKTTPVDADEIGLIDSASTFTLKKLTWANLKATLKTYFDTLYMALSGNQTIAGIKTFSSSPIVPTPTTDMQVSTKKYVDDKTVPDATNTVKGIDFKSLLAEYTVTGSACTSIDFSGLDINTHKSYRVEIELINATASLAECYCFVNGDTTTTNYYTQVIDGNATTVGASRTNYPTVGSVGASSTSQHSALVLKANGYVNVRSHGGYLLGSSIRATTTTTVKIATVTNITQLTFTSSVASAIGVGSKVRIYRGDV